MVTFLKIMKEKKKENVSVWNEMKIVCDLLRIAHTQKKKKLKKKDVQGENHYDDRDDDDVTCDPWNKVKRGVIIHEKKKN